MWNITLSVVAEGAALPAEHAGVASLVAAVVDEAPLLAGVEGFSATRTSVVANADLRIATKWRRIWNDKKLSPWNRYIIGLIKWVIVYCWPSKAKQGSYWTKTEFFLCCIYSFLSKKAQMQMLV